MTLFEPDPEEPPARCPRCAGELNDGVCPKCRHSQPYPPELYGGTPPHVRGSDTSEGAAESVRGTSGAKRQAIRALIAERPSTCDGVEIRTGWSHQTVSARIRELVQLGAIRDTGRRARTRSGRLARVYAVVAR